MKNQVMKHGKYELFGKQDGSIEIHVAGKYIGRLGATVMTIRGKKDSAYIEQEENRDRVQVEV